MNLANLYKETHRYEESEVQFKTAMEIQERLAKNNPNVFETALARTQVNLANLYFDIKRYGESKILYESAMEIYKRYIESHPSLYRPFLSIIFHNLSNLYGQEKSYSAAYEINSKQLTIISDNFNNNANEWKEDYSLYLLNQSFYANLLGKFKEGEKYSLEAIKVDPSRKYVYTNLAPALLFQGKVKEAEELYRKYKADFKDSFIDDFAEFERLGVIPEERKVDVKQIKAMLNEE